jgi:hypothetical protein
MRDPSPEAEIIGASVDATQRPFMPLAASQASQASAMSQQRAVERDSQERHHSCGRLTAHDCGYR